MGEGWTGGASNMVKAESSGEDPMATGNLVSNLPHPRVKQHTHHTLAYKETFGTKPQHKTLGSNTHGTLPPWFFHLPLFVTLLCSLKRFVTHSHGPCPHTQSYCLSLRLIISASNHPTHHTHPSPSGCSFQCRARLSLSSCHAICFPFVLILSLTWSKSLNLFFWQALTPTLMGLDTQTSWLPRMYAGHLHVRSSSTPHATR